MHTVLTVVAGEPLAGKKYDALERLTKVPSNPSQFIEAEVVRVTTFEDDVAIGCWSERSSVTHVEVIAQNCTFDCFQQSFSEFFRDKKRSEFNVLVFAADDNDEYKGTILLFDANTGQDIVNRIIYIPKVEK